jgi:hypothetical protein
MTQLMWRWLGGAAAAAVVMGMLVTGVDAQDDVEKGRAGACRANMKQLALGLTMYMQDYDERFPPPAKWSSGVLPYVKNRSIFRCPSDAANWSYALNQNVAGNDMVNLEPNWVMLFESNIHRAGASGLAAQVAKPARHYGGSNYALVNGETKRLETAPPFGKPRPKATPKKKRR